MTEESTPPWWTRPRRLIATLGPEARVVSAAIGGLNLSLFVVNRYLPEYLRVLGAAPWIIGLFGSAEIALALVYPYLDGEVPDWLDARHVLTVAGGLASIGVLVWLTAPRLGGYTELPAWGWIFVGLFLVAVWNALGLRSPAGVAPERDGGPERDGNPERNGSPERDGRHATTTDITGTAVVRWLGLGVGFSFAAYVLVEVGSFVPSFQVLLAVAASIALTATILQDLFVHPSKDSTGGTFAGVPEVRADIRGLPDDGRLLFVGDTLVRFAHGMVATFFVTVVTSVLRIDVTLLGHHVPPSAFFGVLLAVEMGVAAVAGIASRTLTGHLGRVPLVMANVLVTALFPALLVAVPSEALVVGVLFAGVGLRRATLPVRRALIAEFTREGASNEEGGDSESARQVTESYRLLRGVIVVPGATLGGVLYGIDPRLAFGIASAIGLVGVAAFHRFIRVNFHN